MTSTRGGGSAGLTTKTSAGAVRVVLSTTTVFVRVAQPLSAAAIMMTVRNPFI